MERRAHSLNRKFIREFERWSGGCRPCRGPCFIHGLARMKEGCKIFEQFGDTAKRPVGSFYPWCQLAQFYRGRIILPFPCSIPFPRPCWCFHPAIFLPLSTFSIRLSFLIPTQANQLHSGSYLFWINASGLSGCEFSLPSLPKSTLCYTTVHKYLGTLKLLQVYNIYFE